MRLPREFRLPDLMGLITRIAPSAHIRLALTPDSSTPVHSPLWIARNLVVDVYPAVWVNKLTEGPLAEYNPPRKLYDYPGQAEFYVGYVATDTIRDWFTDPEVCGLTERYTSGGHGHQVHPFRLQEVHETAHGQRVYSGQNDGFARLPWPRTFFDFSLKGPNFAHSNDQRDLYAPDLPHFDDFREARGRLIHALKDLRSFQERDQIVIRIVDADGWIQQAHRKGRAVTVSIHGLRIHPAQVMVKGTGLDEDDPDNRQTVIGGGAVEFALKVDPPPDLRIILANGESGVLDEVWRSPYPGPLDTSSPHFIVDDEEPVRSLLVPTSAVPVKVGVAAKRELRVIVVSPSDVKRERESIPDVLEDLNEGVAGQLGIRLVPWRWETDTFPGFHVEGPQGQIDEQMRIEDAYIVIGIFWARIGTRLADGQSGTEHELLKAAAAWENQRRPHVMIFFNERPFHPKTTDQSDQLSALYAFRDKLKEKGLLGTYPGSTKFPRVVQRALQRLLLAPENQGDVRS